jgi:phosphatidyl-myo-inositol dimannoside synthase
MTKVLLVTRNFPPLQGGMERLLYHTYQELHHEFGVFLVGPLGAKRYLNASTGVIEIPLVPLWRFLALCQWQTYKAAKYFYPNLILSGSGVTVPAALAAGRRFGIPVMTFVHGLDLVADHIVYKTLFLPAIRACDGVIANSSNTARLASEIGVSQSRISVLHPGVALPKWPLEISSGEFRKIYKLGSRPLLLSVGRLTARKGLVEFIEKCMPSIVAALPDAVLMIIGDEAKDAVSGAHKIKARILQAVEAHSLVNNVMLMGAVDDNTLAQAYAASQLFVFPVLEQSHDVEGFGMVALEAAAYGVPTVAFQTGGVPDAVVGGVSGHLIASGDYERFALTIVRLLKQNQTTVTHETCRKFAEAFAWNNFGERLRAICSKVASHSPMVCHKTDLVND